MKTILIFCFIFCAIFTNALAEHSTAKQFSGIETMRFKNGVYPYSSYSGLSIVSMSSDSTERTIGDGLGALFGPYVADSVLTIGNAPNIFRTVCLVDISDIPDSAIIINAVLRLAVYGAGGGYTTGANPLTSVGIIDARRLFFAPSSDLNWLYRDASEAIGWVANGASDSTGAWVTYNCFSDDGFNKVSVGWNYFHAGSTCYCLGGAIKYYYPAGNDSAYSGAGQGVATQFDKSSTPDIITPIKLLSLNAINNGFCDIDITKMVYYWHMGLWENDGVLLTVYGEASDKEIRFISNACNNSNLKPQLIVKYILVKRVTIATNSKKFGTGF